MFQIDNHKELAFKDIIPYLLSFPEIYKLTEQSGDRAQIIENTAWKLLRQLNYETANGVWLDYIGRKVGQDRIYTPTPNDAFTYGGTKQEGFGAGKFKGIANLYNTKLSRTDSSFRDAIRARIIQNNTDTSLDELIKACKLLFNAKVVFIQEKYPANIEEINLYGSSLLKTLDANLIIRNALPAGVSVKQVVFRNFYNLFKNNAFITYTGTIPSTDDFELSMIIRPDVLADKDTVALFSQDTTFASEFVPVSCFYNKNQGITFMTSPSFYNDNDIGITKYEDGLGRSYVDSDAGVLLNGAVEFLPDTNVELKITRVGNIWSMYLDKNLIDREDVGYNIPDNSNSRFYLGTAEGNYFNLGSIYNLYLKNNTKNEIIINDSLKSGTIGINNGVKFI